MSIIMIRLMLTLEDKKDTYEETLEQSTVQHREILFLTEDQKWFEKRWK